MATTTTTNSLEAWTDTNDALTDNLRSVLELLEHEPWSADANSPYVRAEKEQQRLLVDIQRHAVTGMKQIDAAIASSGQVAQIGALAKEAKREADLIKNAAKTIDGITKAVDLVAGVVDSFNSLPFV